MCGILAIYSKHQPFQPQAIQAALTAMHHRGPDECAFETAEDKHVVIGHRRLSIVDVQHGQQPFVCQKQGTLVAVNGEFYDDDTLRQTLIEQGYALRSHSDSELALHLYQRDGLDFVRHLRGEFAIVIWDPRQQQLIAIRDRFGIKPLYYTLKDGIAVASEAKALFALGVVEPTWDEISFHSITSRQYIPGNRSLFQDVSQVPPGHILVYRQGLCKMIPYWDMNFPQDKPARDEEITVGEFRHLLEQSVQLRLRGEKTACVHLSGGIDSTTIACLMARWQPKVDCFTVSFDDENYDELQLAKDTANHLGANLHIVNVGVDEVIDNLEDAVYASEGLSINGHHAAKYCLNKAIHAAGFKVALTGEGADECLAGYPHLKIDLGQDDMQTNAQFWQTNHASRGIMLQQGDALPLIGCQQQLGYIPAFIRAKAAIGYKMQALLHEDFKQQYAGLDSVEQFLNEFDIDKQLKGRSPVDQSVYLWSKSALTQYILRTLGDGCEMAHSVEGRVPFLDHHLFDYCKALPLSHKINASNEKIILRKAVADFVPAAVVQRPKHPFLAPPMCSQPKMLGYIQDVLRSQHFKTLRFFDEKKVTMLLDTLNKQSSLDKQTVDPLLFTILTSCLAEKRFMQ